MCTVTYIPQSGNTYILTSNRDEQISRNASAALKVQSLAGKKIVFPQDPGSGGTWIAASGKDWTACLLNGASIKHHHQPPYRKSRGIVTLDLFSYPDFQSFIDGYELEDIEPFTLIVAEPNGLTEFRWDGIDKHSRDLDTNKPYIWSSVTLYDEQMIKDRNSWFEQWLRSGTKKNPSNVMEFHHFGGQQDLNYGYVMNRNNQVQTLSITSIIKKDKMVTMVHKDLVNKTLSQEHIEFYQAQVGSH